jgi:DNA-binding Lrp family transcriptional regulator
MKLSDKSIRVLAAIQYQAQTPVSEIARQTGLREHTVRYCINSLLEQKIIRPWVVIDTYRMGYKEYGLFFRRSDSSPSIKSAFLDFIVKCPGMGGISEYAGDYHYMLLYYCRRAREFEKFLDFIGSQCQGYFESKALVERIEWTTLRSKYLSEYKSKVEGLGAKSAVDCVRIDELDHQILYFLGQAPLVTRPQIAKELGQPLSNIDYRIRRLQKNKVIVGFGYWIEAHKLGCQLFRIMVVSKISTPEFRREFQRFAFAHPNITGFTRCIGAWDFDMRGETPSTRELGRLTDQIRTRFGNYITDIKVIHLIQNYKICLYPFPEFKQAAVAAKQNVA